MLLAQTWSEHMKSLLQWELYSDGLCTWVTVTMRISSNRMSNRVKNRPYVKNLSKLLVGVLLKKYLGAKKLYLSAFKKLI